MVKNIDLNKQVFENDNELESDTEDVLLEVADPYAVIEEVTCKITCNSALKVFCYESHVILFCTTSRSESENSFFKSFTSPGSTLVNFMMSYESAMERQRYRQEAFDFKTINAAPKCETKLAIEHHANRDIDVIPKQYVLSKDEEKMSAFVEKLKLLKDEVKADVPNPPSRNTGDVIGGIFSISKHNQIDVQNPTKAVNIGEHLKREERLKSEREKALKVRAKAMKVSG
ncbi:hypothetical protein Tco_1467374 [Tanacetum coccineum]